MGEARRRKMAKQHLLDKNGAKEAIANAVRSLHFDFGPGGICWYRVASGLFALNNVFGLSARPFLGAMIFRTGPDPMRDVVAFCGPGNIGCWSATSGSQ
jgi:hypothetical protein